MLTNRSPIRFITFHLSFFTFLPFLLFSAERYQVDDIGITVTGKGRQFVYTNKEAGTYYGEVNGLNSDGWYGWFVNAQKIMIDYSISSLNRAAATTTVYPHQLVRNYPDGSKETLTLLDKINAIVIQITSSLPSDGSQKCTLFLPSDARMVLQPGDQSLFWGREKSLTEFVPSWVGIFSEGAHVDGSTIVLPPGKRSATVIIAAGSTAAAVKSLFSLVTSFSDSLIASRKERMEVLLQLSHVHTGNREFDIALQWAKISMDALIMNQTVGDSPTKGIFAGLPWFNNYWGRDSFISLPGATYIWGNSADARRILLSYANFQEKETSNPNFGRIPNLATPTSVTYNTADGTPWFVRSLYEYCRYSNDTSLLRILYPVIVRSIEGTLRYHTDSLNFLTHGDAETWMDAVGPEGPWSSRGNRACDIQALWYRQLLDGSELAFRFGDTLSALSWKDRALILRKNFNQFFINKKDLLVYDHLHVDGTPSLSLRPNQLFCIPIIDDEAVKQNVVRTVSGILMYPHGVSTLSPVDSNFHPFHHYEPYYVQDAAYHNGIVWTWLNGIAIDNLCLYGEKELAFQLTENMVHQMLHRGCIGALSELLDAVPRPGEPESRLSGTYSQAWSLAEFIRVFYQSYLGLHLNSISKSITVAPRIPSALGSISCGFQVESSKTKIVYIAAKDSLMVESLPAGYTLQQQKFPSPPNKKIFSLAIPVYDPNIPALRGPSYPILPFSVIRRENKKAKLLFDKTDPAGDDRGPSNTYVYPTNVNFVSGISDLTRAVFHYDAENLYITLQFKELHNPGWHPEYGYQLTFAAIAIDRGNTKGTHTIGLNSNYTTEPSFTFDRLIAVGGGFRILDEKGSIVCEYLPRAEDAKNPIGNIATRSINFSIPLIYLGVPSNKWKVLVLAGAQDDHGGAGVGEFRTVDKNFGEWIGGGKTDPAFPNVYDILLLKK